MRKKPITGHEATDDKESLQQLLFVAQHDYSIIHEFGEEITDIYEMFAI